MFAAVSIVGIQESDVKLQPQAMNQLALPISIFEVVLQWEYLKDAYEVTSDGS